jgi:hypothetical protein
MFFDAFHDADCLIVGYLLRPDVLECKIDDEPQSADLLVLFRDCLFQVVVIHIAPPPKAIMLRVAGYVLRVQKRLLQAYNSARR